MKTLKEQTDEKVAMGRKANPDFMKSVDEVVNTAREFQEGKNAVKIDTKAPNFELPNAQNKIISLESLVKEGPVVVTFYRGSWCPYCNIQLKAMQSRLADIHALGAKLVAISPQVPDDSLSKDDISKMDFIVLSDQNASVASQYGVAWKIPEFLTDHMKVDRGLDLESINNGNADILPIPATYVIGKDGIITWRQLDVDYRTRAEPEDIIDALKKLNI